MINFGKSFKKNKHNIVVMVLIVELMNAFLNILITRKINNYY